MGTVAPRVVPLGRRRGGVLDPPSIFRLGVWRRLSWMRLRWRQVVRVQCFFGGVVPDGDGLQGPLSA